MHNNESPDKRRQHRILSFLIDFADRGRLKYPPRSKDVGRTILVVLEGCRKRVSNWVGVLRGFNEFGF